MIPVHSQAIRLAGTVLFMLSGINCLRAARPPVLEYCDPSAQPAPLLKAEWAAAFAQEPESTRVMAARLQEIASRDDLYRSPFRLIEAVDLIGEALEHASSQDEILKLKLPYADRLLRAGKSGEAVKQFDEYEQLLRLSNAPINSALFTRIYTERAIAYLRLGEQENCYADHNSESCLLPIRGRGVHRLQRGSRGAITALTTLLQRFPGDLRARWLLNIAYMTVGEYPQKVPANWRIDPQVFESPYDIKRFPDVAGALGLDVNDMAGGVIMDDFDQDGLLDLVMSAWGVTSQLRYFHNNGDGTFSDRTASAGLIGEVGGLNIIQADYNNDGWIDVLVLRGAWRGSDGHYPNSLLRNNGNGTFTDVTSAAGLLSFHPTQTAVWFDYNGDGWLDLFIGNESEGDEVHPCELYRNNRDGSFTECAAACGVDLLGFVKGVVSADFNDDGRPDLYLSRRDGANILLRNDGPVAADQSPGAPWKFTDVAADAGVTEPFHSFSCWFWDYDNDGHQDLMVTGYFIQDTGDVAADYLGLPQAGERARLYHNRGDGTFADVTQEAGVLKLLHTMGCNFGDLDNDGFLDFYVGTGDPDLSMLIPNRMFRNDGKGHFQDVTTSGGFGQLQKGHGIAFGDIDNDGDEDIYSVVGGAITADSYRNQLFANPGHGNHWLKLKLEGVRSNRDGMGARVKVVTLAGGGQREIHRTVGSGGSFGANPLRLEIGLGDASQIKQVEIFWPTSRITQILTNLQMDQAYKIREDQTQATPTVLARFDLPSGAGEGTSVAGEVNAHSPHATRVAVNSQSSAGP